MDCSCFSKSLNLEIPKYYEIYIYSNDFASFGNFL